MVSCLFQVLDLRRKVVCVWNFIESSILDNGFYTAWCPAVPRFLLKAENGIVLGRRNGYTPCFAKFRRYKNVEEQ